MHRQRRLVRNGQIVIVTTDTSADNLPHTVTYTTYDIYDTLPFPRQDSYHYMTKYYVLFIN